MVAAKASTFDAHTDNPTVVACAWGLFYLIRRYLIGMVANIFLQLPALHLAISAVFILISSGAILFETSNIIHGGETNYIRATVSLYVSLYNIFVSLLSILGFASRD